MLSIPYANIFVNEMPKRLKVNEVKLKEPKNKQEKDYQNMLLKLKKC
jgi:hypothetical protein